MADPISGAVLKPIIGGIGGAIGGIGEAQQQRWENDFAINLLNHLKETQGAGYEDWLKQMTPLMFGAQNAGAGSQSRLFDDGSVGGNYNSVLNNMWTNPGDSQYSAQRILGDYGGALSNDMMNNAQGSMYGMGGAGGRTDTIGNTANQVFQNGGWTPQRQQFLDQLSPLLEGKSQSQQQQLLSGMGLLQSNGANKETTNYLQRGNDVMNQGGSTPWLEGLIQNVAGIAGNQGQNAASKFGTSAGQNIIGSGGYDPQISNLLSSATNVFNSGGRTPQIDAGSNSALQGLASGGRTNLTQGLGNTGLDLFNREALMSDPQAASFAMDTAGTATKNAYEALQRQAQARGGGPGNVVAAGNSTGAMADFADKLAENQAQGLRDTMQKQQELKLQQRGLGAQTATGAQGLETSRYGTFADLLGGMENAATGKMNSGANMASSALGTAADRLGTGFSGMNQSQQLETQRLMEALGLVPTAQNSATSRAGTMGGLGLTADSNNINRLNTGANLLQNFTGGQQNAANSLNSFIGNQDQYQNLMAQLGLSAGSQQAGIMNNLSQNELAALKAGLDKANMFGGLVNNQMQNSQAYNNMNSNLLQGSWNPLTALSGQSNDYAKTALSGLSLGNAPTAGKNASVFSSMGSGIANGIR